MLSVVEGARSYMEESHGKPGLEGLMIAALKPNEKSVEPNYLGDSSLRFTQDEGVCTHGVLIVEYLRGQEGSETNKAARVAW